MKYRIVSEGDRFYVEFHGRIWPFWWSRLMSLNGWWVAPTLERALDKVAELRKPEPQQRVIYYVPDRPDGSRH